MNIEDFIKKEFIRVRSFDDVLANFYRLDKIISKDTNIDTYISMFNNKTVNRYLERIFTRFENSISVGKACSHTFAGLYEAYVVINNKDSLVDSGYDYTSFTNDAVGYNLKSVASAAGELLSPEEELALVKKAKAGDRNARKEFILRNLRLSPYVAKNYKNIAGVSFEDMLQEGYIGVMKAYENFNPDLGFKFSTYAIFWIEQTIRRYISNCAKTIRRPVHVELMASSIKKARSKLCNELFREPTADELAEYLKMSKETIRRIENDCDTISLSTVIGEDEDTTLEEMLADDALTPDEITETKISYEELRNTVETVLTEPQARVMKLRFGLDGGGYRTLEEVGQVLGVTRERVRQIEAGALPKLKKSLSRRDLKEPKRITLEELLTRYGAKNMLVAAENLPIEYQKVVANFVLKASGQVLDDTIDYSGASYDDLIYRLEVRLREVCKNENASLVKSR